MDVHTTGLIQTGGSTPGEAGKGRGGEGESDLMRRSERAGEWSWRGKNNDRDICCKWFAQACPD